MILIAAVDNRWGIGYRGAPLFHISADLRRFKALTMGRALLMGRKTFDNLPKQDNLSKQDSLLGLLPGRAHAVLSRGPDFAPPGVTVLRDLDQARAFARDRETFLIGGGEIYAALLKDCGLAYITKIDADREADAYMPNLDALPGWQLREESPWMEEDGARFRFCTYAPHSL